MFTNIRPEHLSTEAQEAWRRFIRETVAIKPAAIARQVMASIDARLARARSGETVQAITEGAYRRRGIHTYVAQWPSDYRMPPGVKLIPGHELHLFDPIRTYYTPEEYEATIQSAGSKEPKPSEVSDVG